MLFNNYAKYYNLLYKDKDYKAETGYIESLIMQFSQHPAKTLLDIGCGTGTHAYHMAQLGYQVTGIDSAPEMINQALAKKIPFADFRTENATNFFLEKKFDIITSLFHVLSYQITTESAMAMIKNASAHMNENGLFIFDFWYGPAVLTEKPSIKIRRLEDDEIKVTRIAEPVLSINNNIVDVNFELIIHDKQRDEFNIVKEIHPMRYFFKPEIEFLLDGAGLYPLYFNEWMTGKIPSDHSWGVCCVASKK